MRTALVVVDMLNDFVDGVLGNPAAKEIIGPIASLAEQARANEDWRVVYANDAHQLSDVELQVFHPMPWWNAWWVGHRRAAAYGWRPGHRETFLLRIHRYRSGGGAPQP